jgi:hypothetical protein
MNPVLTNELRFDGYRRVQNLILNSENFAAASWNLGPPSGSATASVITFTGAGNDYRVQLVAITSGHTYRVTCTVSAGTKTGTVVMIDTATASAKLVIALSATPTRYSFLYTAMNTGAVLGFDNRVGLGGDGLAGTINATQFQYEDVTNQTNQNPSENVSTGVLSSPYYGAFADGVQYFSYLNGNTVVSNVVVPASGTAINPTTTLKGINEELAATNYFLNSTAPSTQTISLGIGTYIVWMYGTGSVVVSLGTALGTGTGTATNSGTDWYTSNSFVTLVITTAGTIVCTDTGSVTFVQVENSTNGFPTSPIITAGASATRAQDVLIEPKTNVPGYSATQGWFQAEVILPFLQGVNIPVWGSDAGDTPLGFNALSDARTFNGTTATSTANAATALAVTKLAMTYGTGPTESVCLNAGTVASSANAFLGPTTNFQLYGGGARWTRKLRAGNSTLTAAQLQTVTGSTY